MTVISTRKLAHIAEQIGLGADARQTIIDAIGEDRVNSFEPACNLILVGTYIRSNKTKGGIIMGGDNTRAEDRYQGKVGLVLKLGPMVNGSDRPNILGGPINVGDWIMYRTSDAHEFFFTDKDRPIEGSSVRLIEDGLVMGRIVDPETVF